MLFRIKSKLLSEEFTVTINQLLHSGLFEQVCLLAASLSANLRIQDKLDLRPHHDDRVWWTRNHPYVQLNDQLRELMWKLGRCCRNTEFDAQRSSYWDLLEHKRAYLGFYEFRRDVQLTILTPRAIYDCLDKGNKIHWGGLENVSGCIN
jgi:hypothetical protein